MGEGQTDEKITVLGIYAHPHDCVHALGTCGNHVRAGDSVTVAILTDGASTHHEKLWDEMQKPPDQRDPGLAQQTRQDFAAQKKQEVVKACGYFGVTDVRVLGYRDRPIRRTDEMVTEVADLICDVRPDILITELHELQRDDRLMVLPNDHCTCAAVVQEAIIVASHAMIGSDRVPHKIACTYYLGTEKAHDKVDVYVDISDQYENRVKAEMCYVSQGHTPEFARARMERSIGHYGLRALVNYAESFVSGNKVVRDRLPITDRELSNARIAAPHLALDWKALAPGNDDS